jgi:hypothetical protein
MLRYTSGLTVRRPCESSLSRRARSTIDNITFAKVPTTFHVSILRRHEVKDNRQSVLLGLRNVTIA